MFGKSSSTQKNLPLVIHESHQGFQMNRRHFIFGWVGIESKFVLEFGNWKYFHVFALFHCHFHHLSSVHSRNVTLSHSRISFHFVRHAVAMTLNLNFQIHMQVTMREWVIIAATADVVLLICSIIITNWNGNRQQSLAIPLEYCPLVIRWTWTLFGWVK